VLSESVSNTDLGHYPQGARGRAAGSAAKPIRFAGGRRAARVPFDLNLNNVFVRARVNNSRPLWFIFDTGAGVSMIDARMAKSLGLKRGDKAEIVGGGGTLQSTAVEGVTISVGGATALDQLIVVAPLDTLPHLVGHEVAGIIGHDFIKQFVCEINYDSKSLSLYDPAGYRYRGAGEIVPLRVEERDPLVRAALAFDGIAEIEGEFVLDTGSTSTLWMSKSFVAAHNLLEATSRHSVARFGAGLGGESKVIHARARSVRLGSFRLDAPVVRLSQEREGFYATTPHAGTLGGEILRRFRVVLDYSRGRMVIEPGAHFAEPYADDMSGIDLVAEGRRLNIFKIVQVSPDTPGAAAGLRAGDIVESIDGRLAARLSLDLITRMFTRGGKTYSLKITRGRETFHTTLKPRKLV
jgi:predicted aspartyl protease